MAFLGHAPYNFGDSAEFEYDDDHLDDDHCDEDNDYDTFQPPRRKIRSAQTNDCDAARGTGLMTLQLPSAHRCSS